MIKVLLGISSGLILVKKISGISYFIIAKDFALLLGWVVLILIIIFILLGLWGRWFLIRKRSAFFLLRIKKKDRVVILAPHPDDETLAMGGLISYLLRRKTPLKVIFLTCGDGNPSLFWRDKEIKFSPAKFVDTGKQRVNEAQEALKILGGKRKNSVFLGYPDGNLWSMWRNPQKLVVSKTTKLNHSPYHFSARNLREYRGINIMADIKNLLKTFQPTVIFVPHQMESNLDHRAVFLFLKKVVENSRWQGKIYQYLIHLNLFGLFRIYPLDLKEKDKILYPPRRFGRARWFSFWLRPEQMKRKKAALNAYKSQEIIPTSRLLFRSFLAQNEIFERMNYSLKSSKR